MNRKIKHDGFQVPRNTNRLVTRELHIANPCFDISVSRQALPNKDETIKIRHGETVITIQGTGEEMRELCSSLAYLINTVTSMDLQGADIG